MLEWNVYTSCYNRGIVLYNVFEHAGFWDDLVQIRKKFGKKNATNLERVVFEEKVKRSLYYYFGAKCEWEIVIGDWPHGDQPKKVDVYKQIMMNWKHFIIYVWAYRDQLKEKR